MSNRSLPPFRPRPLPLVAAALLAAVLLAGLAGPDPSTASVPTAAEAAPLPGAPVEGGGAAGLAASAKRTPTPTPTPRPLLPTATTVASPTASPNPGGILFGVYPTEASATTSPSGTTVVARMQQLRGNRPFDAHLYMSYNDAGQSWFWSYYDGQLQQYAGASPPFSITLTLRYKLASTGSPADPAGYARWVTSVVARYGARIARYNIGNEGNITWGDPAASDGPFAGVNDAVVQGVIAAKQQLTAMGAASTVGFDVADTGNASDATYVQTLMTSGGTTFRAALGWFAWHTYPGVWPAGTGNTYQDMTTSLNRARTIMANNGLGSAVPLLVTETGYPVLDAVDQASRLQAILQAACDQRAALNIAQVSVFSLRDFNTASSTFTDHYGLTQSDAAMTIKPAWNVMLDAVQSSGCSR